MLTRINDLPLAPLQIFRKKICKGLRVKSSRQGGKIKEVAIPKKISQSRIKALKIAQFALDKKAKHTIVLDVSKISGLCDYFVICSAETGTQAIAILDWVALKAKENNFKMHHFERDELSEWVLGDFSDVILHVFVTEARKFYNLEHLWADAKKVRIPKIQKTEGRKTRGDGSKKSGE